MKLASMFFKASAEYIRVYLKYSNKRARNAKFTLAYFKASADYVCCLQQIYEKH